MTPAPHADDEDTTPARRPAARPTAPPVGPPPRPTALTWGLVGSLHLVEPVATLPDQTVVVRLLPNTIRYTRPPLAVAWTPVKAEPGRFEMAWPGNPATARSLDDVAAEARNLRSAHGPLPPDHPVLRDLDAAVFALLAAADRLHRDGWGVGLVTPAGVMLHPGPDDPEAVLLDLGFTWSGEFGDPPWDHSPGKPAWLSADPAENPAVTVWDRPPVEQQFAAPSGGPFSPQPGSDVRTLARLIGWVLTGTPSRGVAPSDAPVWEVLLAAADGEIPTPAALADHLRSAPPSGHFAAPPPVALAPYRGPNPGRRTRFALFVLTVLVLLIAADMWYMQSVPKGSTFSAADNPSPPPGDFQKALDDYNRLPPSDLAGRLDQFPKVAAAGPDQPAVTELRAKLFVDWVTACEAQVSTSAEAAKRGQAGHELRTLTDRYRAVHDRVPPADPAQKTKEQEWLDLYDRQAEQLGWPR